MTQSYAYNVPAALVVVDSFRVPTEEHPIAKVACSCCKQPVPVTPTSIVDEKRVTCSYCRRRCEHGDHVDCSGCCMRSVA